jgi:hypothetical protein
MPECRQCEQMACPARYCRRFEASSNDDKPAGTMKTCSKEQRSNPLAIEPAPPGSAKRSTVRHGLLRAISIPAEPGTLALSDRVLANTNYSAGKCASSRTTSTGSFTCLVARSRTTSLRNPCLEIGDRFFKPLAQLNLRFPIEQVFRGANIGLALRRIVGRKWHIDYSP